MNIYSLIDRLVELAIQNNLIDSSDIVYCRNKILALLEEPAYEITTPIQTSLCQTLYILVDYAIEKGLIKDTLSAKDIFASNLMDIFVPHPSVVNKNFFQAYEHHPKFATEYFYNLSHFSNYIQADCMANNIAFKTDSPYGKMDIAIDFSTPEQTVTPNKSPHCLLCVENKGYGGPASLLNQTNRRMIRLTLNSKVWMFQYSPYLYYKEHCILISANHEPLKISKDSFYNLLEFVSMFPHYFMGCNGDLPIVGDSILSHRHYHGGCCTFPLNSAKTLFNFNINDYANISCSALNWPLSTIRLSGKSIEDLAECADKILNLWKTYNDVTVDILAKTDDTPHNTITSIARKNGEYFELDLILRNNRTTVEHPLGIFHPHQGFQHIKQENIDLMEVMGLAIFPGKLLDDLESIKNYILGNDTFVPSCHKTWADELKLTYTDNLDINLFVRAAVGTKFTHALEDAGVFKLDTTGIKAFKAFTETFNY